MIEIELPFSPNQGKTWTEDRVAFLVENYPKHGRDWCAEQMGLTPAQIRAKASRLQLKARGLSEAWKQKQSRHSEALKGRKRPEQSLVMRELHASGKLAKTEEQAKRQGEAVREWIKRSGHPRGALGMKHSEETLKKLSEASSARWQRMTDEQKATKTMRMMRSRVANGTYAPERPKATWKAGWRDIGGNRKYYRSKWEANYAYYLEWLKQQGQIVDWLHEPRTFWFEGVKRGCVSYLPDFWVKECSGAEAYHEVKGWMDSRSLTKIKRMAKYHPDVVLIVVDASAYKKLKKQVAGLVPGWEA